MFSLYEGVVFEFQIIIIVNQQYCKQKINWKIYLLKFLLVICFV